MSAWLQVGACIVNEHKKIVGIGYNGCAIDLCYQYGSSNVEPTLSAVSTAHVFWNESTEPAARAFSCSIRLPVAVRVVWCTSGDTIPTCGLGSKC